MAEDNENNDNPPVKRRSFRVGRLKTTGDLVVELGRLFRRTARNEIPSADASRMASILAIMKQCLESSEQEQKLAELEAQIATIANANVVAFRKQA
jgi:hypothetical protein